MALGSLTKRKDTVTIKTVKGSDAFLVLRMSGTEYLGKLFEFTVEVVRDLNMLGKSKDTDLHDLLGTAATVKIDHDDDPRYFNGVITKMNRGQRTGRYDTFTITLKPWLWFATRNRTFKVWQNKSVKDIVSEVLRDYNSTDVAWRLLNPAVYTALDYCVQYDESDFQFVGRLLEEVGIYYFFEHADGKHTLVLIDAMARHKDKGKLPPAKKIKWRTSLSEDSSMVDWTSTEEVLAFKAVVADHNYLSSATAITANKQASERPIRSLGTMEVYENPAHVVQNSAGPTPKPATAAASQAAKVLLERLQSQQILMTGYTNARDIACGATFQLENDTVDLLGSLFGSDDTNIKEGKFLVVGTSYGIEYASYEGIKDLGNQRPRYDGFECKVIAAPTDGPAFRPERTTPRPVAYGPETAKVVGASGNEIETDKHGRVKVQFRWDREGKNDQNSSCWLRVAQNWAGKGFGSWTLPRVGDEVVVSFLGGNPDRPLVTGSVYNDENPVAWELPKHATVSGIKTRTSKGGTAATAHELRFDDAKDKEYIWLQAEKDFYRNVKQNAFDNILGEERRKVKLSRREVIVENWYMDVRKDVMHNFGKDWHVNAAGDVFLTGKATWQVKLDKGMALKTGKDVDIDSGAKLQVKTTDALLLKATGDMVAEAKAVKIKAQTDVVIEGTASITLKVGGNMVCIGPAGVDIVGTMVKVNSGGAAKPGPSGSASPAEPAEAKKHPDTEASKDADYDKLLKDPMPPASSGA